MWSTLSRPGIAQDAGATSVMALERVPADIRAAGGVARMADPTKISEIMEAVSIPVMAKCRIGHFVEAQVLEAMGVDYIDESEVLTPADEAHHVWKHNFKVPFVCGCRNLGEALRRVAEGAAMIRTKGEAGTGDVVEAVRHMRSVMDSIRQLQNMSEEELPTAAKELGVDLALLVETRTLGRLPVVNFAAGGVATPADAALMMQLGADGVFRRLGHLQVRRPGEKGQGNRGSHHPLQRPEHPRRCIQGPGRADGGHRGAEPQRRGASGPARQPVKNNPIGRVPLDVAARCPSWQPTRNPIGRV